MAILSRRTSNLDFIAEIAARACAAHNAVVIKRPLDGEFVEIVGQFGNQTGETRIPIIATITPDDSYFEYFENIQENPLFEGHPIRKFRPKVNSLLVASLGFVDPGRTTLYILGVFNVGAAFLDSPEAFGALSRMVDSFRGIVKSAEFTFDHLEPNEGTLREPMAEPLSRPVKPATDNPANDFLLETLARKQTIHSRNDATYLALRAWRKSIREHQLAAVTASKKSLTDRFLKVVADEMTEAAIRIYGRNTIKCVVPVPGGSSRSMHGQFLMEGMFPGRSFSEQLADRIAEKLGVPCLNALEPQAVARGRSHPKKSARLGPYKLSTALDGTVLLVDDIVTSGRHMELAQAAIRQSGQDCFAISWIGP